MPTLRILNWQNLQPQRHHTEFSVQKLSAMYNNGFQVTSENTLREFPLVIATVAKVSRKRGLWLVVRVKKIPCRTNRCYHFSCLSGREHINVCPQVSRSLFTHLFSIRSFPSSSDRERPLFHLCENLPPGMNSVRVRAVIPVILPWIRSQLLFHNKCR